jgi:regulatory protein spx
MVTMYVTRDSTPCIKAKQWFQENDIPFIERNLFSESLTLVEFKEILRLTDNGTEDILSTRSKALFQKKDIDIDQLPLKELYGLIKKKPGILRTPIIHDKKRLLVGFNQSQIRRFLPKSVRILQLHEIQKMESNFIHEIL